MDSSPNQPVSVSAVPTFNSRHLKPKCSFHSRSNTISDDEIAIGNINTPPSTTDIIAGNSNSDTYDDIDTETEDYFSSDEEPEF